LAVAAGHGDPERAAGHYREYQSVVLRPAWAIEPEGRRGKRWRREKVEDHRERSGLLGAQASRADFSTKAGGAKNRID